MKKYCSSLILAIITVAGFINAAAQSTDSLMMTGEFSEKQATGIYVKGSDENLKENWSVFLGNDEKVYKIKLVEHKIAELYIDGGKITNESVSRYSAVTKPFLDNLAIREELENLEKEIDDKEEVIDQESNEIDEMSDKIDKAQDKLNDLEENRQVNLSAERDNLSKLRDKTSKLRDSLSAKRDALSAKRNALSEKRDKIDNIDEPDKVLNKIIGDLKAEGIIQSSKNVSFKLSNREFIVNGKRQPAEVHQKMKAKYVIETLYEAGFLYRWKEKI
jgi:hypothetical protein